MKWEGGEESGNVEDRRGVKPAAMALGGGSILVLIVGYFLGIDPSQLQQLIGAVQGQGENRNQTTQVAPGKDDRAKKFIGTILGFTEKVWDDEFRKMGKQYQKPRLVIFEGQVNTECGAGASSMGPFYCPADKTVYIDPAFFEELEHKLGGSKAEFSQAYVIAHEVGHHIQTLTGYSRLVNEKRQTLPKEEFNKWSVRLELQADYLAGVWAHYGQKKFNFIESGDVEAAFKSANAIGDDALQRRAMGRTSPQNYTHGTAAQRVKWYRKGLETGDLSQLEVIFKLPYEGL